MNKILSEGAYHRYLRDPVKSGRQIVNPYDTTPPAESGVDFRVDGETSWAELFNPIEHLENEAYRKVGGYVRHKENPLDDPELEEKFGLGPFPDSGAHVKLSWRHLAAVPVGGLALFGNFVGPGADAVFFGRPTGMLDLIAKIHDFAYEINGLLFNQRSQPKAFWSRLAKADWIFVQMLEATGREDLIYRIAERFAECKFRGDPELFCSGDRFINPIEALPKDWLMVPPDFLPEVPKISVRGRRTGGRRVGIVRPLFDPYVPTKSDRPDLWIDLVADQVPKELTMALAKLSGERPTADDAHSEKLGNLLGNASPWKSIGASGWTVKIPLSRMGT